MTISQLKLDEEATINFDLKVYGTTEQANDVRMIIEGTKYDIVLKGNPENGSVSFNVPKLKGILESGNHACRVEVVIDGRIFTPLSESLSFENLIECNVNGGNVETGTMTVIMESVKITPKSERNNFQRVEEDSFDIYDYKGYRVLCKGNMYYGFITEDRIIKSQKPYPTIEQLVEAMVNE